MKKKTNVKLIFIIFGIAVIIGIILCIPFINLEFFNSKEDFRIISLGHRCYSRTFPERFNIFDFKKNNVRMPFDGCITPYNTVCKLIDSDFKDFCNNLIIHKNDIKNQKLDIILNHENGNLESTKIQLEKRKNQFINTIKECTKKQITIIFFLTYNEYPKQLINTIKKKYPNLIFKIFVLDWNIYSSVKPVIETTFAKYINIPKPSHNYSEHKDRETREGQNFEKIVAYSFLTYLNDIMGLHYDIENIFNNRKLKVK